MSTEHDSLTVDPRLETLLRGILASDDLHPAQNDRVRARLGLLATEPASAATLTIPAARTQLATPEPEAAPLAAPPQTRLRRQWLQFALAAVAFIAVGSLLTLLFDSNGKNDSPATGANTREQFELIVPWSPDGAAGGDKLYVVPLDGSDPRRLVPGTSVDAFREWSPDVATDGRVVFTSDRDGQTDLYIWDGAQLRRVTNTAWIEQEPHWSPDGSRITFTGPSADRDVAQIWVVNDDGQGLEQLTDRDGGAVSSVWSPDGSRIAFTSIGSRKPSGNGWTASTQLWIMNADGNDQRQITSIEPALSSFGWLDDQHLLATGSRAIVVTADGEVIRELAPDRLVIGAASSAPSGNEVALVSPVGDDSRGPSELLIASTDGTILHEVTQSSESYWGVTWSPDGTQLAYTRGTIPSFENGPPPEPAADWTLAVIDRDSGDERVLLDGVNRANRVVWRRTTETESVVDHAQVVRNALAPLPSEQERRMVLDVEAHSGTDNAFDQWSIELWQHWAIEDKADEGLYVSSPTGEIVTHIVQDAQASLLNWEPRGSLQTFDVPLEYALQRRVLGATLAAVNDPESYNLRSETRDGLVVLTYEWSDDDSQEFNYVNRGEAWIDPQTGKLQRIIHLIDRPDQEPYPARTFTIGEMEILPVGSSPSDAYAIDGRIILPAPTATARPTSTATVDSALPTPDEMGMYRGITLEQAQAIVSFEIAAPEHIPDGLELPGITVVESQSRTGRTYRVEMFFELAGNEAPGQSVQFIQISSPGSGEPSMPEAETTTMTINGIGVNRTTGENAGGSPLLVFWWEQDGIKYQILAATEGDLTPGLVEDLMLSILVPPGPTAEEETARLEQERAEMIPFPIPDTCTVSGWVGPDFRVGRSESAAYFIDGAGLTLGTDHGVLFAGENDISWLAHAPLTTTEALSGPEIIRAIQTGDDGTTVEIPIDVGGQIGSIRDDAIERAWWSTVSFPSEGCWEIEVSLGVHSLSATVYVYPQPPSGEFQQIDGAVLIDAMPLDSVYLPFAASDAVGEIHIIEGEPMEVIPYYNYPPQSMREQGWTGGGFQSKQYVAYNGWNNGERIVLITVIPGRALDLFADELAEVNLGPFAGALDELDSNENLIYTRSATCEEPSIDVCMQKGFDEVFDASRQP